VLTTAGPNDAEALNSRELPGVDAPVGARLIALARETPEAAALTSVTATVTYGELLAKAVLLARELRSAGVSPCRPYVPVIGTRQVDSVIAWTSVLLAGGAYVPLDPALPAARLEILRRLVGAAAELNVGERGGFEIRRQGQPRPAPAKDQEKRFALGGSAPAYAIMTSGTTGKPKMVVVPHKAVVNLVISATYTDLRRGVRVLHASAPMFDAATFEVWGPLLNGGVCVIREPGITAPRELADFLVAQRVDVAFLTTAQFNVIVDVFPDGLTSLRQLLFGGERASLSHTRAARLHLDRTRLTHVYGPTEATTFALYWDIPQSFARSGTGPPIGRPIQNVTASVRRDYGTLLIGGAGLAIGYLGNPAATAQQFLPSSGGARLYDTGDRVEAGPDGYTFLGRLDNQVKVRGFRVDLNEVESALSGCPAVRAAAVLAVTSPDGTAAIVGHVISDSDSDTIRRNVAQTLPGYMMPNRIVCHREFPLTVNGKVDRARLAPVVGPPTITTHTKPAVMTPAETSVTKIWQELLGGESPAEQIPIEPDANFFDVGGTSLTLQRLHNRLEEAIAQPIPLIRLFTATTVREQAALLDELKAAKIEDGNSDER
jgi:amino acid adenylation domain-containing protein